MAESPVRISGIYPHLAVFNEEQECGIGAVVPWADRLWLITYAPHQPRGSTDKLYEISPALEMTVRPESIGGTPANRMIHRESGRLFIGPYAIDEKGGVRTIPYEVMFGRHTGNARSLTDPGGTILYATMEEGFYEVDVKTLEVVELWGDEANKESRKKADLPGYHGKGFYSGQGVYVYANNGEYGPEARSRPDVPSGVLAEWDGKADAWTIVRRNQFTEVTGPGGIHGNENPDTDPIWTVGWDHRSLLMGVRTAENGWTFYRMPKGSHSYDGAHGWNTEWPRIREIGGENFLMTMHGTMWSFPPGFHPERSAGIAPRSNYLKVAGDFARWGDHVVFGTDDTAKAEFLNKRRAKGEVAAPKSQSNLWFVKPEQLDHFGPVIGRGAVWVNEDVEGPALSDPYLFSGYDRRSLHLNNGGDEVVTLHLEVDREGNGDFAALKTVEVPGKGYRWVEFTTGQTGAWLRLRSERSLKGFTAAFAYHNEDKRAHEPGDLIRGLAGKSGEIVGGIVRARDGESHVLSYAAVDEAGNDIGYYEMDGTLTLKRRDDEEVNVFTREKAGFPEMSISLEIDAASVIYTDDEGGRWRLPKGEEHLDQPRFGNHRIAREVATERDLFHAHGSFYELPANNAGGFIKVRPVASPQLHVHDFCSYRGLLILSGVELAVVGENPHIIRSDDGKAGLWVGAADDLWQFGKARGKGGPWQDANVKKGEPSDPYLMTAYDRKILELSSDKEVVITAEVDLTGEGNWAVCHHFEVKAGQALIHEFPKAFQAYWIRFRTDADVVASARLTYE